MKKVKKSSKNTIFDPPGGPPGSYLGFSKKGVFLAIFEPFFLLQKGQNRLVKIGFSQVQKPQKIMFFDVFSILSPRVSLRSALNASRRCLCDKNNLRDTR